MQEGVVDEEDEDADETDSPHEEKQMVHVLVPVVVIEHFIECSVTEYHVFVFEVLFVRVEEDAGIYGKEAAHENEDYCQA